MYCVISWDIGASNPRWSAINERMLDCLNGYNYDRPVNTFYLVTISGAAQIEAIRNCFVSIAEQVPEPVSFVLSPPLSQHTWTGTIEDWTMVNSITTP